MSCSGDAVVSRVSLWYVSGLVPMGVVGRGFVFAEVSETPCMPAIFLPFQAYDFLRMIHRRPFSFVRTCPPFSSDFLSFQRQYACFQLPVSFQDHLRTSPSDSYVPVPVLNVLSLLL